MRSPPHSNSIIVCGRIQPLLFPRSGQSHIIFRKSNVRLSWSSHESSISGGYEQAAHRVSHRRCPCKTLTASHRLRLCKALTSLFITSCPVAVGLRPPYGGLLQGREGGDSPCCPFLLRENFCRIFCAVCRIARQSDAAARSRIDLSLTRGHFGVLLTVHSP